MTIITRDQRRRAEEFLALHHAPELLILPNAWDVVSARLYELEGFKAIATTSAGISSTLGYPDGQRIAAEEMIEAIRRIMEHVSVPVSADLEAGYATAPEGVARSAEAALNIGVVGVNLEDGTGDSTDPLFDQALQTEKIRAVREMALSARIHLVINARTDVYLAAAGTPTEQLRHTIRGATRTGWPVPTVCSSPTWARSTSRRSPIWSKRSTRRSTWLPAIACRRCQSSRR